MTRKILIAFLVIILGVSFMLCVSCDNISPAYLSIDDFEQYADLPALEDVDYIEIKFGYDGAYHTLVLDQELYEQMYEILYTNKGYAYYGSMWDVDGDYDSVRIYDTDGNMKSVYMGCACYQPTGAYYSVTFYYELRGVYYDSWKQYVDNIPYEGPQELGLDDFVQYWEFPAIEDVAYMQVSLCVDEAYQAVLIEDKQQCADIYALLYADDAYVYANSIEWIYNKETLIIYDTLGNSYTVCPTYLQYKETCAHYELSSYSQLCDIVFGN